MEFIDFYQELKERLTKQDFTYLSTALSNDYKAREVRQDTIVDFGYEESLRGWQEAFDYFSTQNMQWLYTDHSLAKLQQNRWMASFWVSIQVEGELMESSHLYMATFERQDEEWKWVRSYIETGVQNPITKDTEEKHSL